ncbi:caspase family protein, partial [Anaerosalibacter bizertensis]|nr:caspase family protein [Anaerosalibacter bizertensis]
MNRKMRVFLALIIFLVAMPNIGYSIEEPSYRALIIGNGGYGDEDELLGPVNDINKMENALKHNYFGTNNIPFARIVKKQDLNKASILGSIRE